MREFWARWTAAAALEYRSEARLAHEGEFAINVRIHARLRRPASARLLFFSRDWTEAARVRVSDGRVVYDRMLGGRGPGTLREGYTGRLTRNISHPLDEAGYCVDQFFERFPFLPKRPPADAVPPVTAERVEVPADAPAWASPRFAWEVVIGTAAARDTLLLDGASYSPLRLVRVGDHGGKVQELLRETFVEVILDAGRRFDRETFAWTARDDAGVLPPGDSAWLEAVPRSVPHASGGNGRR